MKNSITRVIQKNSKPHSERRVIVATHCPTCYKKRKKVIQIFVCASLAQKFKQRWQVCNKSKIWVRLRTFWMTKKYLHWKSPFNILTLILAWTLIICNFGKCTKTKQTYFCLLLCSFGHKIIYWINFWSQRLLQYKK